MRQKRVHPVWVAPFSRPWKEAAPLQKLTYINLRGDIITFGGAPPYVFERVKGLGKPAAKFATNRGVYQHGDTPSRIQKEPRFVEMSFHIQGESQSDLYQKREELIGMLSFDRCFDGMRQGRLIYENDYKKWRINAIPDGPSPDKRMQNWFLSSKLTFRCSDPDWQDEAVQMLALSMGDDSFQLPFQFPIRLGRRQFSGRAENLGQVDTPVRITINGTGEMPSIVNHTTGSALTVSRQVAQGEVLYIDTEPENMSVILRHADGSEETAHGYLSIDTPLIGFFLRPGPNDIEYRPSQASSQSRVRLEWNARFEGV